ncbi:MAG: hypothetical protein IIB57_08500 [Planctomycetes bacterium]|nr:hypothetical protein [Planctomycetota bacterium]
MAPACGGLTLGYFVEPHSGLAAFRGSLSGEFEDARRAAKKQKPARKGGVKKAKKGKKPKKPEKSGKAKKKNPLKS